MKYRTSKLLNSLTDLEDELMRAQAQNQFTAGHDERHDVPVAGGQLRARSRHGVRSHARFARAAAKRGERYAATQRRSRR